MTEDFNWAILKYEYYLTYKGIWKGSPADLFKYKFWICLGVMCLSLLCMYEYKSKRKKEEGGEEKGEGTTKKYHLLDFVAKHVRYQIQLWGCGR